MRNACHRHDLTCACGMLPLGGNSRTFQPSATSTFLTAAMVAPAGSLADSSVCSGWSSRPLKSVRSQTSLKPSSRKSFSTGSQPNFVATSCCTCKALCQCES